MRRCWKCVVLACPTLFCQFAMANVLNSIDPARAWDATFDAVKAANPAEGFTGEDGELALRFKGQSSVFSNNVPDFDVEGIFRDLATRDYERAVQLARGFQGRGPASCSYDCDSACGVGVENDRWGEGQKLSQRHLLTH